MTGNVRLPLVSDNSGIEEIKSDLVDARSIVLMMT